MIMKAYEELTKKEVMELEDWELLKYINYMLLNGYTMAKINREKGIRRQTVRDRLKKIGYRYDEEAKQYLQVIQLSDDNSVIIKEETKNEDVLETVHESVPKKVEVDSDLMMMIRELQKRQEELEARLDILQGKDTKLENKRTGARLPITVFKSEAKIKNYPIYPEVFERITQLKVDNPHLKVKDIVNSLLNDALDRLDQ